MLDKEVSVSDIHKVIHTHILEHERPKRRAFSTRFPKLTAPIILVRRSIRSFYNYVTLGYNLKKQDFLPSVVARHSSLLHRKLGQSDPQLQVNKITNLRIAVSKLNGLVIPPGKTFSFWHEVGKVRSKDGYVKGMLLSNGKVTEGIGGGLCQLSNFLFWIFLHADVKIIERYHHSVDAFPDSGRTLPFGSGATIFSNFLDLKIKNISGHPLQIKLWLTDNALKGQIMSSAPSVKKFHVFERNHSFARKNGKYFRFNEIFRQTYIKGIKTDEVKIVTNFAPVVYPINSEYLNSFNGKLIEFDK